MSRWPSWAGSPSLMVRTVCVDVKATLSYNLSKHSAAERPQKPQGLLGTGERGWGDYCTYRYTVIIRMTPALRWAAMRAILMFR